MIAEHGAPAFIRSDNGPEFIGRTLGNWLKKQNIKTLYIASGSPWQNGYVESLHDKFRRECLGRERLNAEWLWMIGNGSITRSDHIEVSGCKAHWSLAETNCTTPRFFLRYGLRPPLRKNLAPPPQRDKINVTPYSTWARKSGGRQFI